MSDFTEMRRYATTRETAVLVGMSERAVRELAISGRFPAPSRLGHRTLRWPYSST